MVSGVQEDLLSLQKKLTVGDASLSLKQYVEELQQKYDKVKWRKALDAT